MEFLRNNAHDHYSMKENEAESVYITLTSVNYYEYTEHYFKLNNKVVSLCFFSCRAFCLE